MHQELTEQDRKTVEAHLRAFNKLQAVLKVRQATGASLQEAMEFLAEFEQQLDPPLLREVKEMGMDAKVMAIGPYRKALADHMYYAAERYANTQEGTPVIQFLFQCYNTDGSVMLAECFNIAPWDFNQHKLDPYQVDIERLQALCVEECEDDCESFRVLRDAGFEFYYLPEG